jgi:hypothetical protein
MDNDIDHVFSPLCVRSGVIAMRVVNPTSIGIEPNTHGLARFSYVSHDFIGLGAVGIYSLKVKRY